MGHSLSKGFDMEATLRAKSDQAAGSLAAAIRGFLAMAETKQDAPSESVEALRKIQIAQGSSSVSLSLFLTEAEVQKLQAASQRNPPRPVTATPAKNQPAQRKTLRLVGQENGPIEVPLHPN